MKWMKGMPVRDGHFWLRIVANDYESEPVIVRVNVEPGCVPQMKLIGSGISYTPQEAKEELLEKFKTVDLYFMGPITPPEDWR